MFKKQKVSKKIINVVITCLFLLTFILGMVPVYPFGEYMAVGDVITSKFTRWVIYPIYPLYLLINYIEANIPNTPDSISFFLFILSALILVIYYFYLSKLIVYVFTQSTRFVRTNKSSYPSF